MSYSVKKCMLFSAGFGERLKPLTDKIPKPMLAIGDRPLLDYQLAYLKRSGIEEVIINLHHLGEVITAHVGNGKKYGLKVTYTHEEKLLGTAGGLKNAESHFKNEAVFATLNSAALTNCDLQALTRFHLEQKASITLVVRPWQPGYTQVAVERRQLTGIGTGRYLFTGLTLMTPAIFGAITLQSSNLVTEGVETLRHQGEKIAAFEHAGYWRKIENSKDYQAVQEEWASQHQTRFV